MSKKGPNMLLHHFCNSVIVFYRNCSRKLVKDFGGCHSGANRSPGFSGKGSDGAVCSFVYHFVTHRKQIETSYPCLRR